MNEPKHLVFVGLGSNIEDRQAHIEDAFAELAKIGHGFLVSSLYETTPVGLVEQPEFLNAVCRFETTLSPEKLFAYIQGIEAGHGRQRDIVNGPRTLDLDILLYDNLIMNTSELQIPHPRMAERAFVLVPLKELAPGLFHPILKKSIKELLGGLGSTRGVTLSSRKKKFYKTMI